jgi:hypothetical protein
MKLRDVAFCGSNCTNKTCKRYFTQAEKAKAGAWWKSIGDNPPSWPLVAFADFSAECNLYRAPNRITIKDRVADLLAEGRTVREIALLIDRTYAEVHTIRSRLKRRKAS